jgi:hypothetical protein
MKPAFIGSIISFGYNFQICVFQHTIKINIIL